MTDSPRIAAVGDVMHVLLVEDDTSVRSSVAKALTGVGYEVVAVGDCAAAFAALGNVQPGVVICDLCLPGADGTSIHRHLEQTNPHLADKVVFVTGWIEDPNARNLLAYTGRPVLRKPVEIRDLLSAVNAVTGLGVTNEEIVGR